MSEKMKAMEVIRKDGFTMIQLTKPAPQKGEVLVKVLFSALDTGVDAVFNKELSGTFIHSSKSPIILGWHFTGTVEALGKEVTDISIGAAVWGHLQYSPSQNQGSFAEYITVPEGELAIKPEAIPYNVAAAAATEALTALQAMRDLGGLGEGGRVLILGAGGGVGSAAVGIAKRLGAHATGVCSTEDVESVKALGADVVIDRKKDDPFASKDPYDVVFDTPRAYSYGDCAKVLAKGGAYVTTIPGMTLILGKLMTLFTSKKFKMIEVESSRADLELVGDWLSDGLELPIESTYKVADLEEAYKHRNSRDTHGQIVIDVAGGWTS